MLFKVTPALQQIVMMQDAAHRRVQTQSFLTGLIIFYDLKTPLEARRQRSGADNRSRLDGQLSRRGHELWPGTQTHWLC